MTYKDRYPLLTWKADKIYFTQTELRRLHLHFLHPSANNLFNLLRHACPASTDSSIKYKLIQIVQSSNHCREYNLSPVRFRVVISPEKLLVNHEITIDLMRIEGVLIIHVFDSHTGFQNETVLRCNSSSNVWSPFVECWLATYTGYPNVVRLEQESGFVARAFRDLAATH